MILIAAMTKKGVIGKGPHLPWHIPEELQHFKAITKGNTCIMGLTTYQGIGQLLPNRHFVILSKDPMDIPGADVATSIPQAVEMAKAYGTEIFICGGRSVYAQFLPLVDKLYLSFIKEDYDGDVFFPEWNHAEWQEVRREDKGSFEFVEYRKK
ncbi:MAG: dihydrofolate reductase [Nanoarchaeota archaeon]